eukprot:8960881-Pyramimonas_sp.AAC.1
MPLSFLERERTDGLHYSVDRRLGRCRRRCRCCTALGPLAGRPLVPRYTRPLTEMSATLAIPFAQRDSCTARALP